MNEISKVSTGTIVRTIVLVITLVNQFLTMFGKNPLPFSEDEWYTMLTGIAAVAASLWSWWKNNSFTSAAITADNLLKQLKGKSDTQE